MSEGKAATRIAGWALRALVLWGLVALVFWGTVALLPSFDLPSFWAAVATTAFIAVVNALLWPIVIRLVLPITVLSFGLASLLLNAGVVMLAINLIDGEAPPLRACFVLAIVLAASLTVLSPLLSFDQDARQLRIVRRRARRARERNRTDVPGVILFEIDGLAEPVLQKALAEGHAPTMARWIAEGSHHVIPWECDLSSQTGASQAGLL